MKIITLENLINKGAIYFNSITEGFDKYDNYTLEGSEEEIFNEIYKLREENGIENSFVDFYYGVLKEEEKNRIKKIIDDEYLSILAKYEDLKEVVYLELDNEILKLTAKLNAKEALFSTYYFTKDPCTIWGNYQLRYPVFKNKDNIK